MKRDNSDMKFELAQSSPDQSARTRLNTSLGAGVNADSAFEKTIYRSHPVSESIWSAHEGFSFKCAGSRLMHKVPSPMQSTGPSNLVLSPMHGIRASGTNDDKSITDRKLTKPVELSVNGEAAIDTYLAKDSRSSAGSLFGSSPTHHSGTSYDEEELNSVEESAMRLNEKQEPNYKDQTFCCPNGIQFEDVPGEQCPESTNSLPLLTNKTKHEQVHEKINGKKRIDDSSGRVGNVASGTQILGLEPHGSENAPLEALESSSENNLLNVTEKDACRQSENRYRMERSYPVEVATPEDDKINLLQWKSRKITVAVNDINENLSKDNDDSSESGESCSSATLLSKGKKRGSSGQQLVVGSKRIKSLPQGSASPVKSDSSFMNWISNMVKGVTKANQDECALALSLNHLDQRLECYEQKDPPRNRNHDTGTGNMGFQTIFQSLYCPNTMSSERTSNDYPSVSGAQESLEAEKSFVNVMPISFFRENDECYKQFRIENIDSNHHTSGHGPDLSVQTSSQPRVHVVCADSGSTLETRKTKSVHKNNLSRLTCRDEKDGISALLHKKNPVGYEENSAHLPSEEKVMPNTCNNDDPLRSPWITRFSSRNPGSTNVILDDSSGCQKHIRLANCSFSPKSSEAAETWAKDPVNAVVKDTGNYATSLDASTGFNKVLRQTHEKPQYIQKSMSPTYKSLEPMATEFARRLDVLKSIPSDAKNDAELTARRHRIQKSGDIPTADDLRSKLKDKQELGL